MDAPIPFPSAIEACLMPASIRVTALSQAGDPDRENLAAHTHDALTAHETILNKVKYLKEAAGGAATFEALADLMPTGSLRHPPIY